MTARTRCHGYDVDIVLGLAYGRGGRTVGSLDTSGYLQLDRRSRGLPSLSVHRLVWEAANGPVPEGLEVNHLNGIKTDNRIANLEVVTHRENIRHAYRTGLKTNAGTKHPGHRLTERDVYDIRTLSDSGTPHQHIADQHNISRRQVNDIARRKAWSHLPEKDA